MKQKIEIEVPMKCQKCRSKAMTIAAVTDGVISVVLEEDQDSSKVVVIGESMDAVSWTNCLRKKLGHAQLISCAEVTSISRSSSLSSLETVRDDDYRAFISEISIKRKFIIKYLIYSTLLMAICSKPQLKALYANSKKSVVPNNLKQLHQQDFHPKAVSIGHFHHQKGQHLHDMEEHKRRLLSRHFNSSMNPNHGDKRQTSTAAQLKSLVESTRPQQQQQHKHQHDHDEEPIAPSAMKLNRLINAMKDLEAYARACYLEAFDNLSSDEIVLMMLLDGCLVVELLRLYACRNLEHVDNPIFTSLRWIVLTLQHDLILFENQLPFTVLKRIFKITSSGDDQYSLKDLTLKFFDSLLPREKNILSNCKVDSNPHHLLGLFRSSFLPSYKLDRKSSLLRRRQGDDQHCYQQQFSSITINSDSVQERSFIGCATKLKEAGVVFKKRENEDILNIEFKDGNLNIPYLFIDDHTGPVLLNFVAYEQWNQNSKPYFTQYLMFIEGLLKSSKDVEHLQSEGIIDHVLNSNEDVANLFNKLCKELVGAADDCYLSEPILKHVNLYTLVKKHRRWAKLKEDYAEWKHDHFRSPWAFLSFLAAILLLLFIGIQILFSVLAYVSPRS